MKENRKQFIAPSSLGMKFNFLHLQIAFVVTMFFLFMAAYVSREISRTTSSSRSTEVHNEKKDMMNEIASDTIGQTSFSSCDLFSGRWVFDNESYPLYKGRQCSLMNEELACEMYGRKNLDYQYWRWQPHHCDLPRFDAINLLEKLRNKRVVYVGDSLNRNQWMSMVCLIESSIPDRPKTLQYKGSLITFKALEYNVSVDFYWEPMLLESNCDDPANHRVSERIMRGQSIEKHARNWNDADVLVFNSYIWWRQLKLKILWGSFENADADRVYEDVEMLKAYEMALTTWFEWLDHHVNRSKTRVFFVSSSPTHNRAEEWGKPKGHKCFYETEPIYEEGYWSMDSDPNMMRLVEKYIHKLSSQGFNAQMLNITQLSEYRKDAHPSMHRKFWDQLTHEQLTTPNYHTDCTHWCLPGVPDVWNEFLYAYLFHPPNSN